MVPENGHNLCNQILSDAKHKIFSFSKAFSKTSCRKQQEQKFAAKKLPKFK
jgi:hypothetical protein